MSSNRFKRALSGKSDEILNAGKPEQNNNKGTIENKEIEKYRDIEKEKYGSTEYYNYIKIPIMGSKNGDKFKANFSLGEETMQKIKHMQTMEGMNNREYSKIPEIAINMLYDIYFILKKEGNSVLRDGLTEEEVIKKIRSIEM